MKFPNAHLLRVDRDKIFEYLLNANHPYGAAKARFFIEFGFRVEEWETMAKALREHGERNAVARMKPTSFGPRYEVEGELCAPDGRRPRIKTVWQHDDGEIALRLITAYPLDRQA